MRGPRQEPCPIRRLFERRAAECLHERQVRRSRVAAISFGAPEALCPRVEAGRRVDTELTDAARRSRKDSARRRTFSNCLHIGELLSVRLEARRVMSRFDVTR